MYYIRPEPPGGDQDGLRPGALELKTTADRLSTALVVFRCTAEEAAGIDVAEGPFKPRIGPRGGRRPPIASPFDQMFSDTFEHLSALYGVVTGRPRREALSDFRVDPPGEMARLSDQFIAALAAIGPPRREGQDLVAEWRRLARSWLQAAEWQPDMQVGGLTRQILTWGHECRRASEKGLQAWAWHGNSVPLFVLATGTGMQSYEEYRRAKSGRRRR